MDSIEVNYDFAKAWDLNQGNFAEGIAEKLLTYAAENKKKLSSVYDICCGASNLLEVFSEKNFKCFGTETRQGMYDYSKQKCPTVTYYHCKNMYDMPGNAKVDLVTCTHDIINYLENFDDWCKLFKNVAKHISNHGIFLFDFYTKQKLSNWNESIFTSSDYLDCLTTVKSGIYDKTMISYTYYINYKDFMIKTRDVVVECYYETDKIIEALKKAGFKNVKLVNANFEELTDTVNVDRIHVIASKK